MTECRSLIHALHAVTRHTLHSCTRQSQDHQLSTFKPKTSRLIGNVGPPGSNMGMGMMDPALMAMMGPGILTLLDIALGCCICTYIGSRLHEDPLTSAGVSQACSHVQTSAAGPVQICATVSLSACRVHMQTTVHMTSHGSSLPAHTGMAGWLSSAEL